MRPPGLVGGLHFYAIFFLLPPPPGEDQEGVLMRRSRMSRGNSRRSFTRGAVRTHKRNFNSGHPMRGGIRL